MANFSAVLTVRRRGIGRRLNGQRRPRERYVGGGGGRYGVYSLSWLAIDGGGDKSWRWPGAERSRGADSGKVYIGSFSRSGPPRAILLSQRDPGYWQVCAKSRKLPRLQSWTWRRRDELVVVNSVSNRTQQVARNHRPHYRGAQTATENFARVRSQQFLGARRLRKLNLDVISTNSS